MSPPLLTMVGMCDICDGVSFDESRRRFAALIDKYGWAIQGVEGDLEHEPWAYTVGLVEHLRHPELILTGTSFRMAQFVLNNLADGVREGRRLEPGDRADVGGVEVSLVAVHRVHFEGDVFATWFDQYRSLPGLELTALQVLLPRELFCEHHGRTMTRLDFPTPALGYEVMNRAGRRAMNRRHARRRPRAN
jgi:hypothetical protein